MNGIKNSMKNHVFSHITKRGWIWTIILYVFSVLFYLEFFNWYASIALGLYITVVLVSMLLVGYVNLGTKQKFPVLTFSIWIIAFSIVRYAYIYFFLSHHLPQYTVFHHVGRVIPTVIFSSASLLFLGYSYAIYEWGLAAREKYRNDTNENESNFIQPILIRADGSNVYLLPQDISHISANGEYINYHTERKKYTAFKRLKQAETELKAFGFKRCHRSYIINPIYIETVSTSEIKLRTEDIIPLSKTYKDNFN